MHARRTVLGETKVVLISEVSFSDFGRKVVLVRDFRGVPREE